MKATLVDYKGGRHTQEADEFILRVEGVGNKKQASNLSGKRVVWKTESGNVIKGRIASPHGGKGAVIALFEKGLPGQAIGTEAEVI